MANLEKKDIDKVKKNNPKVSRKFKFRPRRLLSKYRKLSRKTKTVIIIISIFILFFILITTFGRLYLSLNVILGHDVLIDLRVNRDYLRIQNGENALLEFKTSVTSNPFCSAECNYRFVDISTDQVIDNDSFVINTLIPIEKRYDISTNKGTGSKIYRFEIGCSSEETFFCKTTGEDRLRHLAVIVEHELNDNQKDAKIESRNMYENFSIKHNETLSMYASIKNNFIEISRYYTIANRSSLIRELIEENIEIMNLFKEKWNNQEYEELLSLITKNEMSFSSNINTISKDYFTLIEKFEVHNNIIKNLTNSINLIENITTSIIFTKDNVSKINNTVKQLNETIQIFNERNNIESAIQETNIITTDIDLLYYRLYLQHTTLKNNITESLYIFRERLCDEVVCSEEYTNYTYIFNASKETVCNEIEKSIVNASTHNITNTYLPELCVNLKTNISEINVSKLTFENLEIKTSEFNVAKTLVKNPDMCCLFNECRPCCYSNECTQSPVIFVHGHAIDHRTPPDYSMDGFNKLQLKLEDEGILSMGRISLYNYFDLPENIWGRFGVPISLKVSYYYDIFTEEESNIIIPTKNENLETYAIRLREIIDSVLYKTNNSKSIIFAHSMGGLVTRRYMQIFGTDNVDRVMLLGVPNYGVTGIVADLCPIFGENLECRDLRKDSLFLNKLNSGSTPNILLHNVVAIGCEMREGDGDGVVLRESAWLDFAENFIIEGDCDSGRILHSDFIRDVEDSEFIWIVRNFLNE